MREIKCFRLKRHKESSEIFESEDPFFRTRKILVYRQEVKTGRNVGQQVSFFSTKQQTIPSNMFPGWSKIGERREEIVGRKSRGKSKANEKTNAIQRERKRFRHSETLPKKANTRFVVYLEHPSCPSPVRRSFLMHSDWIYAISSPRDEENKTQQRVNKRHGGLSRHGDTDKQNAKKTEQRRRSPRVSDVFVRETYNVSFHVLINSRVITGKLIPQSLSSFNEANYERHKCKHLIVVYTSATRVQNPAVRQEKRRSDSLPSRRLLSAST